MKARYRFPFGKNIVSNKYNFIGIIAGGALVMFVIYIPPFHAVFGGSHRLLPLYWLIPIAFGLLTLAWASFRVVLARRSMDQTRVKDIPRLSMCKSLVVTVECGTFVLIMIFTQSPYDAYHEYALAALTATISEDD